MRPLALFRAVPVVDAPEPPLDPVAFAVPALLVPGAVVLVASLFTLLLLAGLWMPVVAPAVLPAIPDAPPSAVVPAAGALFGDTTVPPVLVLGVVVVTAPPAVAPVLAEPAAPVLAAPAVPPAEPPPPDPPPPEPPPPLCA
ncbi:MAG: hypothetical protein ACJ8EF_01460 [Bradyrhizobium sp.]|jgi:hypothetical protein